MTGSHGIRVEFEGSAFFEHRRSGITRYFAELIAAYDDDQGLGVSAITPYRFVTNVHLSGAERRIHALPLPRRLRSPVLERLNRRAADAGPPADVVHFPLYNTRALDAHRARASVTTVYDFTIEAMPDLFTDESEHLDAKRVFLESCDVLMCISEATRHDLHQFHPDIDKPVVVTPLAVSEAFRNAQARRPRGVPERYLLHVGNRAGHKNVGLLLEAFARLAADDPSLHLVLSGAGMPGESDQLETLGIADRTHLLKVSDADLPGLYRCAAAFVFPSYYEGFGLPVLEAMAAGCPTVVSDIPALVEVAGGATPAVAPDDVDGLVAVLLQILGDRRYADRLRADGRRQASSFSWRRTAELSRNAYDLAARG
jgi:glycosyltransferase involved in cell wall biosynthesis